VGAVLVSGLALATVGHVLYHHRQRAELLRPSLLLVSLLALQITLGALTVLSGRQYLINSLHVVTGAVVLATSLVLTLRAYRPRIADERPSPGLDVPIGEERDARAAAPPRRSARAHA
jgi:heme A synthase